MNKRATYTSPTTRGNPPDDCDICPSNLLRSGRCGLLRLLLATLAFLGMAGLVCHSRGELALLDIFASLFSDTTDAHCSTRKVNIPARPREHATMRENAVLTVQCMVFVLIPLYANMLITLVGRGEIELAPSYRRKFALRCTLGAATKQAIIQSLNRIRPTATNGNGRKRSENDSRTLEGYLSRGQCKKVERNLDESLESLSTHCDTFEDPQLRDAFGKCCEPANLSPEGFLPDRSLSVLETRHNRCCG